MSTGIVVSFEQCSKLIKKCQSRFLHFTLKLAETNSDEDEKKQIKASDCAFQINVNIYSLFLKNLVLYNA